MVIYKATYKCRLCGTTFETCRTGNKNIPLECLIAIGLNEEARMSKSILGGPVLEKTSHFCADGSIGLSDLIGFKAEDEFAKKIDEPVEKLYFLK